MYLQSNCTQTCLVPKLELDKIVITQLSRLLPQERKNLWNRRHLYWPSVRKYMYVCVFVFSQSVASCSHGRVVRLTVCEADDPSSNPALCSFFCCCSSFFFSLLFLFSFSLYWLGQTYAQPNQRLGVSVQMFMLYIIIDCKPYYVMSYDMLSYIVSFTMIHHKAASQALLCYITSLFSCSLWQAVCNRKLWSQIIQLACNKKKPWQVSYQTGQLNLAQPAVCHTCWDNCPVLTLCQPMTH